MKNVGFVCDKVKGHVVHAQNQMTHRDGMRNAKGKLYVQVCFKARVRLVIESIYKNTTMIYIGRIKKRKPYC